MWKIIFLLIVAYALLYSQNVKQKAQITSYEVNIPANKLTKITMYNPDSTEAFTLFENIIEQKQKIIFIVQPIYFSERDNYKNEIVLPFPKTTSGVFYIKYSNQDTSFIKKMIFLK